MKPRAVRLPDGRIWLRATRLEIERMLTGWPVRIEDLDEDPLVLEEQPPPRPTAPGS